MGNERQKYFSCGISVAPVTNWRFYGKNLCQKYYFNRANWYYTTKIYNHIFFSFYADSVYSERYMGQPDLSGNFRGYQESNIIQKFKNPNVNNGTTKKVIHPE